MTDPETERRVAAIVDKEIDSLRADIESDLDAGLLACESPIEMIMLARLYFMTWGYGGEHRNTLGVYPQSSLPGGFPQELDFDADTYVREHELFIVPQAHVGAFRPDFVLYLRIKGVLARWVVECDGHEFHERTREQAARDKQRDRVLQAEGFQVFRYTGSEIWRGSDELLAELEDSIIAHVEVSANIPRPLRRRRRGSMYEDVQR